MTRKQKAFNYMKGFYCAAGIKTIPNELQNNIDFEAGYNTGKRHLKSARESCEKIYGIKFDIIKPMENNGKEEK